MHGEELHPWDKQKGEHAKPFAMFAAFRDMGYERSLAAIAEKFGLTPGRVQGMASYRKWFDRADAYDRYLDQETQKITFAEKKKMCTRLIKQAVRMQEIGMNRLESVFKDSPKSITSTQSRQLVTEGALLEMKVQGMPDQIVNTTSETRIVEKTPEERQERIKHLLRVVNGGK